MARIKIDLPDNFLFSTNIVVQIGDINYGGHLSNDAVLKIAHEARLQMMDKYKQSEMDFFGAALIMSDAGVLYQQESFRGDKLEISIAIDGLSSMGFDFYYLFKKQDGTEVARVKTGMVFFDYERRKICRTPQKFLEFYQQENDNFY